MIPVVDPEGVEVSQFISSCQPEGKKIVEVGCGHASLTYQYANLSCLVVGIDPAPSELTIANKNRPESNRSASFVRGKGEGLSLQSQYFDIALFSSSL